MKVCQNVLQQQNSLFLCKSCLRRKSYVNRKIGNYDNFDRKKKQLDELNFKLNFKDEEKS